MIQIAAMSYVVIVSGVIVFQFCLIAGAPWGRVTQGGRYEGRLPVAGRAGAALSILLLAFMASGIASAAGIVPNWSMWTAYVALAIQALSTTLNWITPSSAERRLWGPVTAVMVALAAYVVFAK